VGFTTTPAVGRSGVRYSTGLIDLNHSEDELFAALKSKTRQEIRRMDRIEVSIRPAENWDEANQFFQRLRTMHRQRSLDYAAISSKEIKAVFEHILKDGELGVLLIASYDQTFLGGLWIFRGIQTCQYAKYVVVR